MKVNKRRVLDLIWLLIIPLFGMVYPLLNNSSNGIHNLVTDLDKIIPFIKVFILPYMFWHPFIYMCMAYFCLKDRKIYYSTFISIVIGRIVAYTIFYKFQTYVPRPILHGNDLFTKLVLDLYNTDKPYNCFPSVHVIDSYLMIKGIINIGDKNKLVHVLINLTSVMIILSTQLIKQHVIMDVVGGIILAEIAFNGVFKVSEILYNSRKRNLSYIANN